MKLFAPFVVLAVAASFAATAFGLPAECAVTLGVNPVFSTDGASMAFQRLEGDVFKIGVASLPDRGRSASIDESAIEWIENGPGNAAYPAWTPDGTLIYMAGNDTETAHEAWKSGSQSGYGLRLWRDGEKRDLTRGRCRDYTPCVSPDGKTIYFITTRGVESESAAFSQAAATRIAAIDIESTGKTSSQQQADSNNYAPRIVLDSPNGNNSGYVQPAVSPDGSLLVWGQLDSFFDSWRICGARIAGQDGNGSPERLTTPCPVTPSSLAALSPRWHPNGRQLCFTGFRKGDSGWGVWVEDIRSGKVKRLATGENPCFSPDGAFLAYDRDGTIYIRTFGPEDEPDELLPDIRDDEVPEATLWTASDIASETRADISGDRRFAFGDGTPFFVRAKVRLDGTGGVRQIATGDYGENPRAFQLYASGGDIWFSTRGFDGKWLGVKAAAAERRQADTSKNAGGSPAEHSIVAVRTAKRLVLSVDGGGPKTVLQGPFLGLDTPHGLIVGVGLKPGESIDALEIGTGWPKELPKGRTREDIFR